METSQPNDQQHSSIKPHLVNLSSSGSTLHGIIVERNLEKPDSESDNVPYKSPKHVIVLHSKYPAKLEWRNNGTLNNTFFSEGDLLINPAGLFVAPHWKSPVGKISDYHITTAAHEHIFYDDSVITRICEMAVIDVLFFLLADIRLNDSLDRFQRTEHALSDYKV
jgi:hypothetical protein